jgi:hypothetical protein
MLRKLTFFSDEEMNRFFEDNSDEKGKSNFFLVKSVVAFNPFTRQREFHVTISRDYRMAGGEHLRKGNGDC